MDADSIRKSMRKRRSNLSSEQLVTARDNLKSNIVNLPQFRISRNVAAYIAICGEICPNPILTFAQKGGKFTFLPIVFGNIVSFAPVTDSTSMCKGKFDIPVPKYNASDLINPDALDLVLVPLVAFDSNLQRIGMGGGFYDRSFSFRAGNKSKPILVGIAHDFQKVDSLCSQPWDIPMDIIVTDKNTYSNNF